MSADGLAAAAARFLEAETKHEAARARRKKGVSRKPRPAAGTVEVTARKAEAAEPFDRAAIEAEEFEFVPRGESVAASPIERASERPEQPVEPAPEGAEPVVVRYVDPLVGAITTDPSAESIEPAATPVVPIDATVAEEVGVVCPDCDLPVEADADQCPHCALFLPRAA